MARGTREGEMIGESWGRRRETGGKGREGGGEGTGQVRGEIYAWGPRKEKKDLTDNQINANKLLFLLNLFPSHLR